MFVEEELFVLQQDEHFVLYAPKAQTAIAVSPGVIRDLQTCAVTGRYPEGPIRDSLERAGVLHLMAPERICSRDAVGFSPTKVTLFPTSDCGLRCVYCYASAGVESKLMELDVARAAIDLIVSNALEKNVGAIDVSFTGGGEPFYGPSLRLVREIVAYSARVTSANGLGLSLYAGTNGVISTRDLDWIARTFKRIAVSIDGPPDLHDSQRPSKTGGTSAAFVQRTIAYLEKAKCSYGLRVTITRASADRQKEIVAYLHRIAPSAPIHIEPLFSCGRCTTTGAEPPDEEAFVKGFLEARSYAATKGIDLQNSGGSVDACGEHFCGATRENFCITPWGQVTSCYEVSLPSDPRGRYFYYGFFDRKTNSFIFDRDRLARLRARHVSNIQGCSDCFLKYACAGDCPAKSALGTGSLVGGFRCNQNRAIGASTILHAVAPGSRAVLEEAQS